MIFDMIYMVVSLLFFFFKQKTAYEMRISDWSSDVCSSDLQSPRALRTPAVEGSGDAGGGPGKGGIPGRLVRRAADYRGRTPPGAGPRRGGALPRCRPLAEGRQLDRAVEPAHRHVVDGAQPAEDRRERDSRHLSRGPATKNHAEGKRV